jgi:hypothetical protein
MKIETHHIAVKSLACLLIFLIGAAAVATAAKRKEKLYKIELISKSHTLDQVIPSMQGPTDTQHFSLSTKSGPELVWLKSTRVDIIDEAGDAISTEFLCHSNLYFDELGEHQKLFSRNVTLDQKFVDINQGQLTVEMPEGFGIPLMSSESLRFHSMVINPTAKAEPLDARVKTTFEYLRDDELVAPIKALSQRALRLRVPIALPKGHDHSHSSHSSELPDVSKLETKAPHADHAGHSGHGSADGLQCDPEQETYDGQALTKSATKEIFKTEPEGPIWSIHWLVPPGRHDYRYRVEAGLRMPFDETTVHMITTHVHPYAESIELHDLTVGERIFRADIENFDAVPGVSHVPHYSSLEGLPIYKNHEYEMVVVYNNPTDKNIDAMALLYLYYWDRNFTKPTPPTKG